MALRNRELYARNDECVTTKPNWQQVSMLIGKQVVFIGATTKTTDASVMRTGA